MHIFGECHAHIFMDGVDYQAAKARYAGGPVEDDIRKKLAMYREAGITFYRDGGDRFGAGLFARKIAGEYGIDIRTPGFAIHKRDCYGGIVGKSFDTIRDYRELVLKAKREGGDFIKIMCSGLLDFDRGNVTGVPLEGPLIKEMVKIAHDEGMAVMSHVDGARVVLDTVLAGADSIEHGFFADEECLDAMKETGTVWVPTISTVSNLAGGGRYPDELVTGLADRHAAAIRMAWKKGVNVALGSDAGAWRVPHVKGIQDEYRHVKDALSGCASEEEMEKWLIRGEELIKERFIRSE